MSNLVRKITVFLSSPGGLSEERDLVETVCKQLTHDLGNHLGFVLEVLRWETHTRPAAGLSAQDTINKQMGIDYDIYLGILGVRFGTETKKWGSGTEEEFELAYESWRKNSRPEIMFYFSESAPNLSHIDPSDLQKRQIFKKKLEERGVLHFSFPSRASFEHALRKHLTDTVKVILDSHSDSLPQQEYEGSSFNPLQNWTILLENDPAVQVENFLASGGENLRQATKKIESFVDRTGRATRSFSKTYKKMMNSSHQVNAPAMTKSLEEFLASMSNYSRFLISMIPDLDACLSKGLSDFSRGFVVAVEKIPDELHELLDLAAVIESSRQATEETKKSVDDLARTMEPKLDDPPAIRHQKSILYSLIQDFSDLLGRSISAMSNIIGEVSDFTESKV
ncbi:DUF4062 domain-containing protein [Ruegeria sp. WL0004]|uniref:DUF4062 domain-containing protein n=1 Tax=Ruegeria marisflavi TaxID=2984152 RepID=A0ABT2WSJ3_9RHOB|nr:DUF4062 domain-containing protein [Ruegeria sp. WL0004]MCU9838866.1 DUF4062 domain-containing protein [Ruegeria sp. WL0004]